MSSSSSAPVIRQVAITFNVPNNEARTANLVAYDDTDLTPMIYGDIPILQDDSLVNFLNARYPNVKRIILRFQFKFIPSLEIRRQQAASKGQQYNHRRAAMGCLHECVGQVSRALDTVTPMVRTCEMVLQAEMEWIPTAPGVPDVEFEREAHEVIEALLKERAKVIGLGNVLRSVKKGRWIPGGVWKPDEYVAERVG